MSTGWSPWQGAAECSEDHTASWISCAGPGQVSEESQDVLPQRRVKTYFPKNQPLLSPLKRPFLWIVFKFQKRKMLQK